jgi:four helix bundle protein
MGKYNELIAYQNAYKLAMKIFELSKRFPNEEVYSLTDQIRRSSRSVCANLAESYSKRRYPKHFISKLSDSAMENTETQSWLDFAYGCEYIDENHYRLLKKQSEEMGNILKYMISNPNKFS